MRPGIERSETGVTSFFAMAVSTTEMDNPRSPAAPLDRWSD
jgi:hypothetical protein